MTDAIVVTTSGDVFYADAAITIGGDGSLVVGDAAGTHHYPAGGWIRIDTSS